MFYIISAKVSPIYNSVGQYIPMGERKYSTRSFNIFSQTRKEAIGKAARKLAANEYSHNGIKIVA